MAGRLPYEEVVIDGDTSSDDDDAVVVVTPAQSRKRRRQSAIHDDDDEGAASQSSQAYPQPPPPSGGPHAPTNNSRGTTSGSIDQEDEDDEVEIIQISTPSSAEAKRRKLTVVDSDEEEHETTRSSPGVAHRVNALQLEPVPRLAASSSASTATPRATRDSEATSTGRRSTRIERKREEKARAGPSARKLEFLSLENCLDPLSSSSRRAAADEETEEDDDEDFIVNDGDEEREEEEDEVSSRRRQHQTRRPRARSPPPRGFTTADDEDLDEFIVADDEVEYMDDDEEGVMDEHLSSADELNEEEDADGHALRMTMQSREPSEWFAIYLRYLEECILDDDLDNKIRLSRRNPEYRLFEQAIHHIERAICSRRDTLRSSVVWNDDIMDHLHCATKFHSTRCTATTDCQACRRANHFATQLVQFCGFSCDSTELYRSNWMKKLRSAVRDLAPMRATFELGTVCHARTLGFWQLLHAKHFWVALVDAKRQECGDGHGRIAESERNAFHKAEYGRYKRLISLVDKFSTEATKSVSFMPNVWKKVNAHHVHSEFLPSPALRGSSKGGVRRGTLDSLVGDSDGNDDGDTEDEEEEEEEEREEELEEKPLYPTPQHPPTTSQREEDNDDAVDAQAKPSSRKRMRQSTLFPTSSTNGARVLPSKDAKNDSPTAVDSTPATKPVKALNEIEAEDLVCLVCRQNQRDGAIAHGNYLHFYSCYRCAKRQHAAKQGCMVCDRPIQNVLRILPLSKESRADILKQQQAP